MESAVRKRVELPGKKRILALDGGGIRGAVALGFLKRMESILAKRYNDPDFRLSQYFDLIAGTSTGSIIASALAIGMKVDQITKSYIELGKKVFYKPKTLPVAKAKYRGKDLDKQLAKLFGDMTLSSAKIQTGLFIYAKRLDTKSLWTFTNNPNFRYFDVIKDLSLVSIIRASTAAPTFFRPVKLLLRSKKNGNTFEGIFTDGGMSMANNPALYTFLASQSGNFGFKWEKGVDNLLLVSIGTGNNTAHESIKKIAKWGALAWATNLPRIFMADSKIYSDMILHCISDTDESLLEDFDNTFETLKGLIITDNPSLSYLRYDINLNKETLEKLGFNDLSEKDIKLLNQDDRSDTTEVLFSIGEKQAKRKMKETQLKKGFDIK